MRPDAATPGPARPTAVDRPPKRMHGGLVIAGVAAIVIAAFVVVTGVISRSHQASRTQAWTSTAAIPTVSVVSPSASPGGRGLTLPGTLQAYYNASIYSRVSGYVRAWYFDIGARVTAGQVLALIDTPETDQQIIQARADVATATANMQLASTTAARWARLLKQDAVSQQESEEKTGDLAAKTAQVQAAKANLNRLRALKSFSRITAPFDGVITARRVDIGALVNAGAGATPNSELFDVAKVDRLRLYVRVPQVDSAQIKPGVSATLAVPELPGRRFPAMLSTTANAISDASGTLLAELMVDNADGLLTPGAYAQVQFNLQSPVAFKQGVLLLPSSAILFRGQGVQVALVDAQNHIRLQTVSVGRDLGSTIEINSGLSSADRVVNNPPDSIADGQLVRVIDRSPGAPSGPSAGG